MSVWRVHFGGQSFLSFNLFSGMADWKVSLLQTFLVEWRILRIYLPSAGVITQS
jgi:hypothetical protein